MLQIRFWKKFSRQKYSYMSSYLRSQHCLVICYVCFHIALIYLIYLITHASNTFLGSKVNRFKDLLGIYFFISASQYLLCIIRCTLEFWIVNVATSLWHSMLPPPQIITAEVGCHMMSRLYILLYLLPSLRYLLPHVITG